MSDEGTTCPACGGAGGGPFGRPGSAWDVETYVCPRCQGLGIVRPGSALTRPLAKAAADRGQRIASGPGIAAVRSPAQEPAKRRASSKP